MTKNIFVKDIKNSVQDLAHYFFASNCKQLSLTKKQIQMNFCFLSMHGIVQGKNALDNSFIGQKGEKHGLHGKHDKRHIDYGSGNCTQM